MKSFITGSYSHPGAQTALSISIKKVPFGGTSPRLSTTMTFTTIFVVVSTTAALTEPAQAIRMIALEASAVGKMTVKSPADAVLSEPKSKTTTDGLV